MSRTILWYSPEATISNWSLLSGEDIPKASHYDGNRDRDRPEYPKVTGNLHILGLSLT